MCMYKPRLGADGGAFIERTGLAELRISSKAVAPLAASIAVIGGRERCMTKAAFLIRGEDC